MNLKNKLALSLATVGVIAGGALTIAAQSYADTTTPTTSQTQAVTTQATDTSSTTLAASQTDPSKGGHIGQNGIKEVVLTGDAASKATAAALAAVPGGTIQRVENDAEGAVYEAHMTKADGSRVTVKLDSNFAVTATETGFGGR